MLFVYFSIFILGSAIGSFLNVLIDRLPKEEGIGGRSHCDYCKKKLNWFDMFPVFSYFILGGKTRCCHKKLSFQYPMVEMTTAVAFLLISNQLPIINYQLPILLGIISCLIVIFISDLKYQLISDYMLLAFFVFSLLLKITTSQVDMKMIGTDIFSGLIVAFPIWLIYFISRERAMGLGDVYLAAIMGFLLGWEKGLLALYIAFITGAIFGSIVIILKMKKLKSKIAFGPFLVIGTVLMLFWGEKILEIVKKIYGF